MWSRIKILLKTHVSLTPRSRAHHRWLFAVVALLAMGTLAAIQQGPDISGSKTLTIIETLPTEVIQLPNPEGGMMTQTESVQSNAFTKNIIPQEFPISTAIGAKTPRGINRWIHLRVHRRDTLAGILRKHRLYSPAVHQAANSAEAYALRRLRPGHAMRLGVDANGKLEELVYEIDGTIHIIMQRDNEGHYQTRQRLRQYEIRHNYVSAPIQNSLFSAGRQAGLSNRLILKLAEIFGWDLDFALDLRRGDRFSVIFEEKYWQGEKMEEGPIIAAEFINRGRTYRAIALPDTRGRMRYYRPDGRSMQRKFLRTPVQYSRISSWYSMKGRYHPILKRWRAHKGVDYAAATGIAVRATATGRILERRHKGGYGKTIVITHSGKYSTLYAHLSRFRRGHRVGSLVKQGEVIGYVGKSGLATGPHLHYEFRVYGKHRNPLRIKMPESQQIPKIYRADFEKVSKLMTAKLNRIGGKTQVASSK